MTLRYVVLAKVTLNGSRCDKESKIKTLYNVSVVAVGKQIEKKFPEGFVLGRRTLMYVEEVGAS